MASPKKATNHCGNKSNKTTKDGKISHAHGLVVST
jgi:hypothetical protein